MADSPALSARITILERELAIAQTRLEKETARLEQNEADLERQIKELRDKTDQRERNLFVAGITFLGGIILTLIGVIWANLGAIFPGR